MGEDRGVVDLAGQPGGALTPPDRLGVPLGQRVQLGLVAVGHREQPGVAGVLQYRDGLGTGPVGGRPVPGPPLHAGQKPQAGAEGAGVTQRTAQAHGLLLGGERRALLSVDVGLGPVPVEQVGLLGERVGGPVVQRQPQVRGGLPMGPGRGRLAGRSGCVSGDRGRVTRLGGVVDDGRQIGPAALQQRDEHPLVQLDPAGRRQRVGDGAADQLVAEGDPVRSNRDESMPLGRGQRRNTARDNAIDQPSVQGGRYDGELFQCLLGGRIDGAGPGEDRVDDRRRGVRVVAGCDHLGDEERIA